MPKPIIAIDIDDVVAVHASVFVAYSNDRWGTRLKLEDYDDHWSRMWGVDTAETERRAEQYVAEGIYRHYPILDQALPALRRLSERYHLVIVTARRRTMRELTLEWVAENLGDVVSPDEVYFAGIWDKLNPERFDETKAEMVDSLGVSYFIEDQMKHAIGAAELGVQSILFGDYTWNASDQPLPARVVRKRSWREVEEYFDGV